MIKLPGRQNLKNKLLLLSSAVMSFCLVSIGLLFAVYAKNQEQQALSDDLNVLAGVIGNRSTAALVFSDVNAGQLNLSSTALNEHVTKACLYKEDGVLFASFNADEFVSQCAPSLQSAADHIVEHDRAMQVYRRITDQGDTLGYITVHASLDKIQESLRRTIAVSLASSVVILLVGILLLHRLIGRLLLPLGALHNTAESIARDPYSSIRAEQGNDDEVGQLVDVFNLMLDRLAEENKALMSSENRFRLLAENSPVGIYQMDAQGKIVYANERWRELTGLKPGITTVELCRFLGAEDEQMYLSILHKIQLQQRAKVIEYTFRPARREEKRIFMEHIAPQVEQTDDHKEFVGFIGSLMDISELKNAQLELENLAFYDPLTNLPNRRFFRDHLQYVLATADQDRGQVAIMMIDLDEFKKVNDTLGHDAGDQLLVVLAERLRGLVSQRDVVSRMGGDEFMVLLNNVDVRANIQGIADRLLKAVEQPISLSGHELETTASIGIAIYPEDAGNAEELIRNADLALYLSKESGRNRVSFFSKKLETQINEKVRMERKLKEAIKAEALSFHVQPQWSLNEQKIISCEVLMRWFDDAEGMIPPNDFIPVAEETGLIHELGDWLLEEVIKTLSQYSKQLKVLGVEYFAINLSAKQFFSSKLAGKVASLLSEYQVAPSMIEFELTESAVMEDNQLAIQMMEAFKRIGCRLSIDDFGTGYSSLSYLKRFPIDAVKIDRSFISDIPADQNDIEISAAIIAMGHSLGLEVVAEGVELEEQIKFLVDQGCDYAQGYLVAKPMPFEELFRTVPNIQQTMMQNADQNKGSA